MRRWYFLGLNVLRGVHFDSNFKSLSVIIIQSVTKFGDIFVLASVCHETISPIGDSTLIMSRNFLKQSI